LLGVHVPPKYGPFNGTTGLKADERNNCTKGTMMKCLRSYARAITFQKNAHSGGNSPVHEFSFFLPILRILLFFSGLPVSSWRPQRHRYFVRLWIIDFCRNRL
jgi:hypothetical protein